MKLFDIAFHEATPHGVLTAVTIPDTPDPVPEAALERLTPQERELAVELGGYRQVQFVGGRLAMQGALRQLGAPQEPVLQTDRGAPVLPRGFVGSVSHKRTIAVAMVARSNGGSLGVDIEEYGPARPRIEDRILTPTEIEAIAHLSGEPRWIATLIRFSIKESIYKAIDPYVRRYVGFHEAEVKPELDGRAWVDLNLKNQEGPFQVQARYLWLRGRLLSSARIRRG